MSGPKFPPTFGNGTPPSSQAIEPVPGRHKTYDVEKRGPHAHRVVVHPLDGDGNRIAPPKPQAHRRIGHTERKEQAFADALVRAAAQGKPTEEVEPQQRIVLEVAKPLHTRLKMLAAERETTIRQLICDAILLAYNLSE